MVDKILALDSVEQLLTYGIQHLALSKYDITMARNNFLDILGSNIASATPLQECVDVDTAINNITKYAQNIGIAAADDAILFETRLFGIITPQPSSINSLFVKKLKRNNDISSATDWLFELSKANRYLRMADINKNIMWKHSGAIGDIIVTINLSKPEKDPKQIQAALKAKSGYPACMLCDTNIGFAGHAGHPARQTLRMIPLNMGGEEWFIQYSPYQYYKEHLIALCGEHRPMKVDGDCIQRLLDFAEQYPHYFMGSNAALPIVGGSILTHDHYQGGGKSLPMFNATIRNQYKSHYKGVKLYTVDWYNSVVRVEGKNKSLVHAAATDVLNQWSVYTDESVGIFNYTDAQHNAVTPIARMEGKNYIVDMILRNNRTDNSHPYGIYHPTEDLHNIKKEGIGIIEALGIFILPGRLDKELASVAQFLTGKAAFDFDILSADNHPLKLHADMIKLLVAKHGIKNSPDKAIEFIRDYVNSACERILECTAVFKNNPVGQSAFVAFMAKALNAVIKN